MKKNTLYMVIDCTYGHQFDIGELVEVEVMGNDFGGYKCTNGEENWYLASNEVFEIGEIEEPAYTVPELQKQIELLTKRVDDLQQQINRVRNPYCD